MSRKVTRLLIFLIFLVPGICRADNQIFFEKMGTVTATTSYVTHTTNAGWNNSAILTFSNGGLNNGDVRKTATRSTDGANDANVYFNTTANTAFAIENIDASTYTSLKLNFYYYKSSGSSLPNISLEYWNGSAWTTVSFSYAQTASSTGSTWYQVSNVALPVAAQISGLKLRWKQNSTTVDFRLDEVELRGTLPTCTGPTTAATTFSSSNVTTTTADLSFTGGNGTSRVAFLKGSAYTGTVPSANTTYTADASFTSGTSTTFDGGKTIYNSTATSVSVTNLTPNTVYNTKIFEYLGAAGAECYNSTPLTGSFTTFSTAATTTTATSINSNGFTANWTAPASIGAATYTYTLEVAGDSTFTAPVSGSPFTGIASGTTSYAISSLSSSIPYYYRVTVVNAAGSSVVSNVTKVTTNAPLPACAAPLSTGNPVVGTPTTTTIPGMFTASSGGADAYMVFVSTSAISPTLVNGTTYSGNNPAGYTVVQNGTGVSFTASSLLPNTLYYIYVAAYNSNAGCTGGPAYSTVTSTSDTTAAGVVVSEADGDYRTLTTGTWANGGGTATWEKRTSGIWSGSSAPSASYNAGKLIIRHTITATTFASPKIAIDNGGTFIIGNTAATVSEMHIYDGGILQVNNALTLTSIANFVIESGGTVNLNYAAAVNTSAIWDGIETFKAGSIVNVQNWNYGGASGTKRLVANPSQISNNSNGYLFGNLTIGGAPSAIFGMIDGNQTIKLTENDFTANTTSGSNVTFTTTSASAEIGGNLIANTNQLSLSASTAAATITHIVRGKIQINGTATVDINQNSAGGANSQINLYGNLEVATGALLKNGNSSNPTSSINFLGDNQNIDIKNANSHGNFIFNINTASKVNLLTDLTISNLTLTNGLFDLGAKNLTIAAPSTGNGTVSGGSSTAYVQGNMIRNTSSTAVYAFPVGKTGYAPVTIQPSAAGTNSFSVVFNKDFKQTPNYTVVSGTLSSVNATEWYDISHPTGTATATVTLPWGPLSGVTDQTKLVVAHYNSGLSAWESLGGTPTGSLSSGTVTVTGVSSFSPFAIGAINGTQPLPVKLASFKLQKESNKAILNWTLQTADGNEKAILQRSGDGKIFTGINTQSIEKSMTVNQSYTDAAPLSGLNQYRLTITGSNGVVMYSNILTAVFTKESAVSIYPNPAQQFIQVDWTNNSSPVTIEIHSMIGKLLTSQIINNSTHYDMPVSNLGNGAYIITWKQGETVKHQQIQVVH